MNKKLRDQKTFIHLCFVVLPASGSRSSAILTTFSRNEIIPTLTSCPSSSWLPEIRVKFHVEFEQFHGGRFTNLFLNTLNTGYINTFNTNNEENKKTIENGRKSNANTLFSNDIIYLKHPG